MRATAGSTRGRSVPPKKVKPSTKPIRRSQSCSTPPPFCVTLALLWSISRTKASTVVRLAPADLSGPGVLSVQGSHDDVAARDICANLAHAKILIGVYFDAGASGDNAGGITVYDPVRSFAASSLTLATDVQNNVLAALNAHGWNIPNDGVVSDATLGGPALSTDAANYGHLLLLGPAVPGWFDTPSEMPGALIEPLFITDPFEASIAHSSAGQEAIASGIAKAVVQYFPPPPRTTTKSPTEVRGRGSRTKGQRSPSVLLAAFSVAATAE